MKHLNYPTNAQIRRANSFVVDYKKEKFEGLVEENQKDVNQKATAAASFRALKQNRGIPHFITYYNIDRTLRAL